MHGRTNLCKHMKKEKLSSNEVPYTLKTATEKNRKCNSILKLQWELTAFDEAHEINLKTMFCGEDILIIAT